MQAICCGPNGSAELRRVPYPVPSMGEVLVRVVAAAQNPTDIKTLRLHRKEGAIIGCDFAGMVVSQAGDVCENDFRVGDRVAGFVHGGIGSNGAFAEYVVCPTQTLLRIPRSWSLGDAAQIGLAGYTACQCLYQVLSLPKPSNPTTEALDILVWGGTTAVGHIAIQLAVLSGMRVITTASPHHADSLMALGASAVFDYHDPKAGKRIHAFTEGRLVHAVDCIAEKTTPFQVSDALSQDGGMVATLLPYTSRKYGVTTVMPLAYTVLGQAFEFPFEYTPCKEDIEFGIQGAAMLNQLLDSGSLVPMRKKLFTDGLSSVFDGLGYMSEGKVSAEKVTYMVARCNETFDHLKEEGQGLDI